MGVLSSFFGSILSAVSDLFFAVLLLVIAVVVAKLAKSMVTKLLKSVVAGKLFTKLGVQTDKGNSIIDFLAKLAYFVVFLLFLPSVLDRLDMRSVSSPIMDMVYTFLGFIPKLIGAGLVIAIGLFIGETAGKLAAGVLARVGADKLMEKFPTACEKKSSLSRVIGEVVKYVLDIIFIVQGINVLNLPVLTEVGASIIDYLPAVLIAVIIAGIAIYAANAADAAIVNKFPNAKCAAFAVRIVIYVVAALTCLRQLGVSVAVVEEILTLVVAALCAAFAIAFGLGGRQFAADMLEKLKKKMEEK